MMSGDSRSNVDDVFDEDADADLIDLEKKDWDRMKDARYKVMF